MNKYSMVVDPIRSKNFAVIIEKKDGLTYIPLNEMAKSWTSKQGKFGNIKSVTAPDGMYISPAKNLSVAQEIMLKDSIQNGREAVQPKVIYSGRQSLGNGKEKKSVTTISLRKVSKKIKLNAVNYKALAFKNRLKISSTISAVKSRSMKVDNETCRFLTNANTEFEPLDGKSSAPSRRIIASYFIKNERNNRISRRAKTLSLISAQEQNAVRQKNQIDTAISSKAIRFS